ncbi:MAG TPA: hypothetical protein VGK02_08560 [Candidatus Aquicultor sp.]
MLKRKILSCILALCLLLSVSGAPAIADELIQPAPNVAISDTAIGGNNNQGAGTQQETVQPVSGPEPLVGAQGSQNDPNGDGVKVLIGENIDVINDGKASATSGNSGATGSKTDNQKGGGTGSQAIGDGAGAIADNNSQSDIKNGGDAAASSGNTDASNKMDDNKVIITPDTTVTVNAQGDIVDSRVLVDVLYNYKAIVTGEAVAASGDSLGQGLDAKNSINSTDTALAIGDAPAITDGVGNGSDGSALATNDAANAIDNSGIAGAASGAAKAANLMIGNDIIIAPVIKTLIQFCGDISKSLVKIEMVYNFFAAITGSATAESGDVGATGAAVDNGIENKTSSKAIGDAPAIAGGGGTGAGSDGSAIATNDTANTIDNSGKGIAASGDAQASNMMINNDITIAPIITNVIKLLDPISESQVVIRVVYNIWSKIVGSASAQTGDADATGVAADNKINNTSSALAKGDAPAIEPDGSSASNGTADAVNDTANKIENTGEAASTSGDAAAQNQMKDNAVNLSPTIDSYISVMRPIIHEGADGEPMVIELTFDVWSTLCSAANAQSGDATSKGVLANNSIDSNSNALALADVSVTDPNAPVSASNTSDNSIDNNGVAGAITGDAAAGSNLSNTKGAVIGSLEQSLVIAKPDDTTTASVNVGTDILQAADAESGKADALGSGSLSAIESAASAKDIFGGKAADNTSKKAINNDGRAFVTSGNVRAFVGMDDPDTIIDSGTTARRHGGGSTPEYNPMAGLVGCTGLAARAAALASVYDFVPWWTMEPKPKKASVVKKLAQKPKITKTTKKTVKRAKAVRKAKTAKYKTKWKSKRARTRL